MKRIIYNFFVAAILLFGWQTMNATGISAFCETTVTHFNIPAETASGVKLTISKIDATSMYVEIESATSDPVDLLIVNNGSGATISAPDASVSGKIRRTLTWATAPANVSIELLWSKVTMGGNWMINTFSVPFDAACTPVAPDSENPTAFTATAGAIGSSSVELLLNATDNSGSIAYSISYGAGPTVVTTSGTSATQKSFTVTGLAPSTAYSFAVTAKDAAGNPAANSPITVPATTTAIPTPAVSPTTPPAYSAAKVISIYSDAFTNVGNINYNPGWGQATVVSNIQIGTNNVMKYSNLNYQGTVFDHVYPVTMKYLHLDVWTADETSIQVFPICWNGTGNEAEKFKTLTPITLNAWNSFDIPLTYFTGLGLTMADVYQLKIVGTGGKTVYLDNIYFYDDSATADTEAPASFTATKGTVTADEVELLLSATDNSGAVTYTISYGSGPTVLTTTGLSGVQKSYKVTGLTGSTAYSFSVTAKDAADNAAANSPIVVAATTLASIPAAPAPILDALKVKSVYSDTYTNLPTVLQNWYGNTFSTVMLGGNTTLKNVSLCCFGYEFTGGAIDVTNMTKLHVDIYPETLASMTLGVTGGGEFKKAGIALTAGQWNSVNVTLSELTGANLANIAQVGLWDLNGTFYLDNLYFFNDTSTGLNPVEKSNDIRIYPNPTKDVLMISAKSEISLVTVRNLVGQTVKTQTVNGLEKSVDLGDITVGNYFVTIKLSNGLLSTQKFVKL